MLKYIIGLLLSCFSMLTVAQDVPSIYVTLYHDYYASPESLKKLICSENASTEIVKRPVNNYALSITNNDTMHALCTIDSFMLGDFIFRGEFHAEVKDSSSGFGFVFGLRDSTHYYYLRLKYETNNDILFQVILINGDTEKILTEGIMERTGQDGWDQVAIRRDIVTTETKFYINYMEVPVETIKDRIFILGSVGYMVEPLVKMKVDNVKIWGPTSLKEIE